MKKKLDMPWLSIFLLIFIFFPIYSEDKIRNLSSKPNIIFILVDDLGKEWLKCYGGEGISTPNIDKLALTGVKFNNVYSMPQCTPSRMCFLTGQYPYNNGWVNHWDTPRWGVAYYDWERNPCIARNIKNAGYATAVAGKWQLNDFRVQPESLFKMGFDDYCMWTGGEGSQDAEHAKASDQRYWNPYIHTKEGSKTYKGEFGPDIYNKFILNFITKNKARPFFIYYPMTLPHMPLVHTPLDMNAKTPLEKHKAMVRYMDYLVGNVMALLEKENLRKNTLIIWTTDNGTSGTLNNMRNGRAVQGGKMKTTENGINAPFIVSCPGLVAEGIESNALVDFTDMLPTFCDLAGGKLESGYSYDGYSSVEVLFGKEMHSKRPWILAMGGQNALATDTGVKNIYKFRDRVVRDERFKIFIDSKRTVTKLVDLSKDPEEKNNLVDKPEYKGALIELSKAIENFPVQDRDPDYKNLPTNPWDEKPKASGLFVKK